MKCDEKTLWQFDDGGRIRVGLSDAHVTLFSKQSSLGRESSQNALGAACDKHKPVRVVYKAIEVKNEDIPGRQDLLKRLYNCRQYYQEIEDISTGGEVEILTQAIECLEKDNVECLLISDFNTRGLAGLDDDIKGNFSRFISQGISVAAPDLPGSYGLGKNALFIAATTRTIYVNSQLATWEKEGHQFLEFGVSRLCTHTNPNDPTKKSSHIGFISDLSEEDKNTLVRPFRYTDKDMRPSFLQGRDQPGTDILLIGNKSAQDKNWQEKLALDLIEAFFLSIFEEKITFEIVNIEGKTINIEKKNLEDAFDAALEACKTGENAIKQSNITKSSLANIKGQIKALRSEVFSKELTTVKGKVEIQIYADNEDESLSNESSIHRNPRMTIKHIGIGRSKLKHFNGVIKITSEDTEDKQNANYYLVQMEDPTHTMLDESYIRDKRVKKTKASSLKTEINNFLRQTLDSFSEQNNSGDDAPGLSKYIPCIDLDQDDQMIEKGSHMQNHSENNEGVDPFVKNVNPKTIQITSEKTGILEATNAEKTPTGSNSYTTHGRKAKRVSGAASNKGRSKDRERTKKTNSSGLNLKVGQECDVRIICTSDNFNRYRIFITAFEDIQGELNLRLRGEDKVNALGQIFLLKAWNTDQPNNTFEANNNCIKNIEVNAGNTLSIDIETKFSIPVAFEV